MKQLEHEHQCALIEWARYARAEYPQLEYLIAIPNGGKRNAITAMKLKAEGVKPGVSDMLLAYPVAPYHGLWLELKVHPNKPTPDQAAWLTAMAALGYACRVVYQWFEGRDDLTTYLSSQWEQYDNWTPKVHERKAVMA